MDSHCHDDVISFHSIPKNLLGIFLVARYRARSKYSQFRMEQPQLSFPLQSWYIYIYIYF
jgi:hypothetical protein